MGKKSVGGQGEIRGEMEEKWEQEESFAEKMQNCG